MTDASLLAVERERDPIDALLSRVARGDQVAFEALYRDTSKSLFGICLRVLSDRAEAEDVLQEVYVAVWHKAAQYDAARARGMTWLGSITRHRAIDRLRSLPAPAMRSELDLAETVTDPAPSPALHAEAAFEHVRLDRCLEQLEPQRRLLIRAAFFEGASYHDLATRSGTPLGSVKSWIRRSLMQLKACLEP